MLRRFAVALLGTLGLVSIPLVALGAKKCELEILAELPVTMHGLRPMVPVKINGHEALFLADSGAFFSMISPANAAEFKLRLRAAPFHLIVHGVGGSVAAQVTSVDHMTLANIAFTKPWDFVVAGSEVGGEAAGILGQNVLRIGDVEYDLANGVIRLVRPEGKCSDANPAYWLKVGESYSAMDIQWATAQFPHTKGVAYLNGAKIDVMFDTGSATSMLSVRAAERAGIKPNSEGVKTAGFSHGVGQGYVKTWIGPFQSFKIGDEEIKNTHLRFGELNLDTDMLVGADFFLSHHVYVASSQRKLYFTYNGGPVFNLTASPGTQQSAKTEANPPPGSADPSPRGNPAGDAPGDAAATASTAGGDLSPASGANRPGDDEPGDAASFARRGAAFVARREFDHAIADLTRACELAPQEPQYFFERAQAYAGNKQPALANADIEQVIKLRPDDVPALIWRAQRRLREKDESGALSDLDAADHASAQQADVRLQLGHLYHFAKQLPQAINQYSVWIAAHPDDVRLAGAYDSRCWARGEMGQELDKALSDCNKALRSSTNAGSALTGRGLIRLRQGDFDHAIADYTAALKLQPKNALSLYGRGLAESRKQKTAAADEDFAAATALLPGVAGEYKKFGLSP